MPKNIFQTLAVTTASAALTLTAMEAIPVKSAQAAVLNHAYDFTVNRTGNLSPVITGSFEYKTTDLPDSYVGYNLLSFNVTSALFQLFSLPKTTYSLPDLKTDIAFETLVRYILPGKYTGILDNLISPTPKIYDYIGNGDFKNLTSYSLTNNNLPPSTSPEVKTLFSQIFPSGADIKFTSLLPAEPAAGTSTPVPEPTSVLGAAAFSTFLCKWRMKGKQKSVVISQ